MGNHSLTMAHADVLAVLAGTKTQLRRVVRHQPKKLAYGHIQVKYENGQHVMTGRTDPTLAAFAANGIRWRAGDRVVIRELFRVPANMAKRGPRHLVKDVTPIWYCADGQPDHGEWSKPMSGALMPDWARRIAIEITDIRVQRIQDISEDDAIAEGMYCMPPGAEEWSWWHEYSVEYQTFLDADAVRSVWIAPGTRRNFGGARHEPLFGPTAKLAFRHAWDAHAGRSPERFWDANPWVFAATFHVVKRGQTETGATP